MAFTMGFSYKSMKKNIVFFKKKSKKYQKQTKFDQKVARFRVKVSNFLLFVFIDLTMTIDQI